MAKNFLNPPPPQQPSLLDGAALQSSIATETRKQMGKLFAGAQTPAQTPLKSPAAPQAPTLPATTGAGTFSEGLRRSTPHPSMPAHLPTFVPTVVGLVGRIRQELEYNLQRLLSLNPSRREAVAQHLDRLAGAAPGPSTAAGTADAAGGLRRWIDSNANPAQHRVLQTFFEEVALIALGQAILLKAWSDRGVRTWKEEDLGRLNWALSVALKPHVPLDREGWQITKPNLYSWYNPSPALQREIWNALEAWRITDEGPSLLAGLLQLSRQFQPDWPELKGYDSRFFDVLWEQIGAFGFDPNADTGPLKRKRIVFSPTLRDGSMVRTGPASVLWIGLESHPFQLMMAELVQLWWGPAAPPIWAIGSGLEVHTRDQLALALGSPKPSLLSRIIEMEACDLSFVMEERIIRSNARSSEATRLREQLDALPYFKKIRSQGSSLGDLQACVALSKLRPGGLLWWAREEPLSASDGNEMLSFLLERGKLLCEWDLSGVEHHLPGANTLFPKFLYLFQRSPDVQERLSHRPTRVLVQGQIRSHVEVPLILSDALQGFQRRASHTKGSWQVHHHQSPSTQKEWMERWPDPAAHDTLRAIEELRQMSVPLASVTTIRPTPQGDPAREGAWTMHPTVRGLWLHAERRDSRRLVAEPLPRQGRDEAHGSGYLVLVPDEAWVAPLIAYIESESVQNWMEHHAERRGERWVLTEQVVKFIPIPKTLLQALGANLEGQETFEGAFALPLPGEWERLASEVTYQPRQVRERLQTLPHDDRGRTIRAALFVRTARALDHLRSSQSRLFSLVSNDGRIRWRELLQILPKSELTAVTMHSSIRLSGTLPPHLPISRIEKVKIPLPGVILATETGFTLHVGAENPRITDMLWEQLDGLKHPTWNELAQYLRLPRHMDLAESTAAEVLRSHGEQSLRLRELADLLSDCTSF